MVTQESKSVLWNDHCRLVRSGVYWENGHLKCANLRNPFGGFGE